ncbi:MAG: hypothetical protein K2K91_02035 [Ruminococcus sp.]|nr:hypothetical protein [Ruminococcus sp.]
MRGRKSKEYEVISYLHVTETDKIIPFEQATENQRQKIMKNISGIIGDYYSCRPDEAYSYIEQKEKSEKNT